MSLSPTNTHMSTCTHIHAHTHAHTCTHTNAHAHTHAHTYMHTHTCTCMRIHTHTHTHAHTHILLVFWYGNETWFNPHVKVDQKSVCNLSSIKLISRSNTEESAKLLNEDAESLDDTQCDERESKPRPSQTV